MVGLGREGRVALLHREVDREHTRIDGAGEVVAGVAEDPHHLAVLTEDEGPEPLDPPGTGIDREQLEETGSQTPALVLVHDGEGDLGVVGVGGLPVIGPDCDHLPVVEGDERHPVVVVDRGEVLDLRRFQGVLDPEEPVIARFRAEFLEEDLHQAGIGGGDGSNPGPSTVAQDHVQLVLGRVFSHVSPSA